ncbi:hypothetical protein TSTA_055330 [Talaromyces stipitatus ATCC 10500]|uniref:Uncharacterized protein n=1 Tax=Talaromyces stipitatus (strain ATCC 10500 / CBS 375.48 / QM 6759 / NRRL 1006) TaxID=441959 RepID=B8MRD3_TALSN|nr:uncharacterized protein TSTA_055330 [Talaromyces stipitatus ATCC 10500]EED13028.1 hypothetical protein TSTA_055330 [Talaromyces stipitatus ATCC 10500]
MASKFIEILDENRSNPLSHHHHRSSNWDVKLEDVLADQEATIHNNQHRRSRSRSRSSTRSSSFRKSHEYSRGSNNNNQPRLSMKFVSFVVTDVADFTGAENKRLRKFTLTGGFGR